jgi:hypothetical protein
MLKYSLCIDVMYKVLGDCLCYGLTIKFCVILVKKSFLLLKFMGFITGLTISLSTMAFYFLNICFSFI